MQDLIKIAEELLEGANDATKTLSYYKVYKPLVSAKIVLYLG
jgi:hypothetical protein